MSYPVVIYGPPDSVPYELTTMPAAQLAQKGNYPLGTQIIMQDGRKFRFCCNSPLAAAALVVGNVITSKAIISTDIDLTPAAGAVGDRLATFTHGAATVVANHFSEGFLVVSVSPGGGDTYKIANHLALQNATAGDIVNFAAGHALRRALTTTSRLDLMTHPYAFVVQSAATTLTGAVVGVAVSAIAATNGTGWLQTAGSCGVLTSGTNVVGLNATVPLGTAGAAGPGATDTCSVIGTVQSLAATGAWSTILLTIDS